jgi:hypothetical protein
MQGSPKDDVFGDFARRPVAWQKPSSQLLIRQGCDGTFERLLIILPTDESARLRDCGPCCQTSCLLIFTCCGGGLRLSLYLVGDIFARVAVGNRPASRPASRQNRFMAGHECYHCKHWVEEGEAHDCWTTTEAALVGGLSEDLRDAWERLREAAASLGEQRIYASHHSIMFSRKTCHFFVRPKQKYLELCVFLGRRLEAPQVRRVDHASKSKFYHLIRITHRDEVEPPITNWLQEAYELSNEVSRAGVSQSPPGVEAKPAARQRNDVQPPAEIPRKPGPASKRTQKKR